MNHSQRNSEKLKITKAIFNVIGIAGFLTMAVVAPNTLQILGYVKKLKSRHNGGKRNTNPKYYINTVIQRLEKKGMINKKIFKGEVILSLTDKGREQLLKYQLEELKIERPKKWDSKWRIVIFDIKEKKRRVRDELRLELVNLGFKKIQQSVWVHPFDCEEVVTMLKGYFFLRTDFLFIVADRIENDEHLKEEFGLAC